MGSGKNVTVRKDATEEIGAPSKSVPTKDGEIGDDRHHQPVVTVVQESPVDVRLDRLKCGFEHNGALKKATSMASTNPSVSVPANSSDPDGDGWQRVIKKRRLTKPDPVRGLNENECSLEVARRMCWVFVSGLKSTVEPQAVMDFLKKRQLDIDCVYKDDDQKVATLQFL